MKKLIGLIFVCALGARAQVYATTITNQGSGYTSVPTVAFTAGTCTVEPTGVAVMANPATTVASIQLTFAGTCTAGGTPPTVGFSGGGGSNAAATAIMIQGNMVMLTTPIVTSPQNSTPDPGGGATAYRYECTLVVPAPAVPFYSNIFGSQYQADRMPGTSQVSQIIWPLIQGASAVQPLYNIAFEFGIITSYDSSIAVQSTTAIATVEGLISADCTDRQTKLNGWNQFSNYGKYNQNGTWIQPTVL